MKVYAISDLHLSSVVKKPMDIFGDGWQNHFQKISEDWLRKVSDDDVVLLGGDMSWGLTLDEAEPDYRLVAQQKGRKFVVKGNHDYYWNSLSKMRTRFPQFEFVQNNAYRIENVRSDLTNAESTRSKAIVIAGSRGWTIPNAESDSETKKIYSREIQRLELSLSHAKDLRKNGDVLIALLHYPPFDADFADTEVTKLLEKFSVNYVLYGHLHGKNVRVTPRLAKNGIEYILTSCDLVDNKLVEVCSVE